MKKNKINIVLVNVRKNNVFCLMILRCWIGIGQALRLSLRSFDRYCDYFDFFFLIFLGGEGGRAIQKVDFKS